MDVTLDLKFAIYCPYTYCLYINKHSNPPLSIINRTASMISNRISEKSCDKHLEKTAPDYNISLKNSGFIEYVTYIPSPSKRQTRKRKIIWFNLPYSANAKIDVGKIFMRLVDKHFPRHHKF